MVSHSLAPARGLKILVSPFRPLSRSVSPKPFDLRFGSEPIFAEFCLRWIRFAQVGSFDFASCFKFGHHSDTIKKPEEILAVARAHFIESNALFLDSIPSPRKRRALKPRHLLRLNYAVALSKYCQRTSLVYDRLRHYQHKELT